MIQTPKVLNHCFDTTTPKVKWLFEQVQTPFRLLAFVSYYTDIRDVLQRHVRSVIKDDLFIGGIDLPDPSADILI